MGWGDDDKPQSEWRDGQVNGGVKEVAEGEYGPIIKVEKENGKPASLYVKKEGRMKYEGNRPTVGESYSFFTREMKVENGWRRYALRCGPVVPLPVQSNGHSGAPGAPGATLDDTSMWYVAAALTLAHNLKPESVFATIDVLKAAGKASENDWSNVPVPQNGNASSTSAEEVPF